MTAQHAVIIGAQKSGTTALHCFLAEHPDVGVSVPKETNFFVTSGNHAKNYLSNFSAAGGKKYLVEASPIYMLRCEEAAPRIAAAVPKAKLIVSLRNPIERAYSQYHMLIQIGKAHLDFPKALVDAEAIPSVADLEFDPVTTYPLHPVQSILLYGQYARQLSHFLRHFNRDQLLVLRHEELVSRHAKTMSRVFKFLDLEPIDVKPRLVHRRSYPSLNHESWLRLLKILEPEIEKLEMLLGWDLTPWRRYPERF